MDASSQGACAPNLYELLRDLPDFRRRQGQRHELRFLVLLIIMALMSGFSGQRAMGDFVNKNALGLLYYFRPYKDRLPSFHTLDRVLQHLEFGPLNRILTRWATARFAIDKDDPEWIALDGKAIAGTTTHAQDEKPRFVSLVSLFASRRRQVLGSATVDNHKESEIQIVQDLLLDLDLHDTVLTLDALHCQSETVARIRRQGGDYCIGVKANQPTLLAQVKKKPASRECGTGTGPRKPVGTDGKPAP